jgi:hypothetical protein
MDFYNEEGKFCVLCRNATTKKTEFFAAHCHSFSSGRED